MALTVSNLTTGSDTTDQSTYTTASVTPTAGALIVVAIGGLDLVGAMVPDRITGNGIVYQALGPIVTFPTANPLRFAMVFMGRSAAPTAGAISIVMSRGQSAMAWSVLEVTGEPARVRQVKTTHVASGTSISTTLNAALLAGSVLVGAVSGGEAVAGNYVPGTDFTELGESGVTSSVVRIMTEWWAAPTDGTIDATWGTSSANALWGLEIAPGVTHGTRSLLPLALVGG